MKDKKTKRTEDQLLYSDMVPVQKVHGEQRIKIHFQNFA